MAEPKTDLKQTVIGLAQLARLELTETETETYASQLGQVLDYVGQLQKIDVTLGGKPAEPLFHPHDLKTPIRADVVEPPPRDAEGKPKVLKSAPDVLYDGYKVPQIL